MNERTTAPAGDVPPDLVLDAVGITKAFNGVPALRGVDISLARGEVHGVVGQNGAGKSTLMKILTGVYAKDGGTIAIDGQEAELGTPLAARAHGIGMVFQEFSLIPTLTVAQNVFLTREPRRGLFLDDAAAEARTSALLDELGVTIDPRTPVGRLPVGSRQLVEIAKALAKEPRILILDEPTASLTARETETLFAVIRRLQARGLALVYISHHLQDLMRISGRVTVLRDGQRVLSAPISEIALPEVIRAMLGSALEHRAAGARRIDRSTPPLLDVRDLLVRGADGPVSFGIWPGEVVGVAGLLGSGRTELIRALYGIDSPASGEIVVRGRRVGVRTTADALALGMALVPEDRRSQGLVLEHTVEENLLLPVWKRFARLGLIDDRAADAEANAAVANLNVKTRGLDQVVKFLSGGNQQKVVVGKSLASDPAILLLDEPTFGIDIRSKQDIMGKVREFADAGNAVLFVDTELEQMAATCDRVLVLERGRIVGEIGGGGQEIRSTDLHAAIHGAPAETGAAGEGVA